MCFGGHRSLVNIQCKKAETAACDNFNYHTITIG